MAATLATTGSAIPKKLEEFNIENIPEYEELESIASTSSLLASEKKPENTEGASSTANPSANRTVGFRELLLKPELMRAINDCGFEQPSEVQCECIPQAVLGTDVLCQAKSGKGKTAVFVLSILQQLDVSSPVPVGTASPPKCIVLCHARELAHQIHHEFKRFAKYLPSVKTAVFYGGVPVQASIDQLKQSPQIVIGTPGRVLQLAKEKHLNLSGIKHFVLDECDRMLETVDMRSAVQKIFLLTPRVKQTMMFSATLSAEVRPICKKFMHNPLEVVINDNSKLTLHGLYQYYVKLEEREKNRQLKDLLEALEYNQCVVFVKSVQRAVALQQLVAECNIPCICITANMPQPERLEQFQAFKEFRARLLISTNLMGRGIDVERVNVVINYDMAESADSYLHRVARAGRFDTKGLAISFVSSQEDEKVLEAVQKRFVVAIPSLPDEIDSTSYM